jgi:hypothetical protein
VPALAALAGRVLVSHEVGTMPGHFNAFRNGRKRNSGVFLIPRSLGVRTAIDELLFIWMVSDAPESRKPVSS